MQGGEPPPVSGGSNGNFVWRTRSRVLRIPTRTAARCDFHQGGVEQGGVPEIRKNNLRTLFLSDQRLTRIRATGSGGAIARSEAAALHHSGFRAPAQHAAGQVRDSLESGALQK